jgi:hypothetical protein
MSVKHDGFLAMPGQADSGFSLISAYMSKALISR